MEPKKKCAACGKEIEPFDLTHRDSEARLFHEACYRRNASLDSRIEALAAHCHNEQWSGWMHYLFSKGEENEDGSFTIPASWYWRWKYQSVVPYSDLPERMRESDREEARAILALLDQH